MPRPLLDGGAGSEGLQPPLGHQASFSGVSQAPWKFREAQAGNKEQSV